MRTAATKGRKYHFSTQRTAQRPADDHTGEQIDKDRQVKPTTRGSDVGDIRHPRFVRAIRRKITLQQVVRDRVSMLRVGGRLGTCADKWNADRVPFHSARHAIFTELGSPMSLSSSVIFGLPQRLLCFLKIALMWASRRRFSIARWLSGRLRQR